jgi:hypothetical protein
MTRRNSQSVSRGSRSSRSSVGVIEMARERPVAAAAIAAGAAVAGLFLWSKRSQISSQLSNLSDQIGEWTENMGSTIGFGDDTAGLALSDATKGQKGERRSAKRRRSATSQTGGGNSDLGAPTDSIVANGADSPDGRGRAQASATHE